MAAIETTELRKEYGDFVAVDDLTLQIEEGEIFGFLGPNGAGKSTTINMLLDYTRPTDGSVTVLGYDAQTEAREIHKRVGILPDGFGLYDRLSGRKHLEFAIRAKRASDDPEALLARVGLDSDDADRKTGGYSKGMKQRLAMGMALVGDPDVLIMDEPSSGLDPTGISEMQELVQNEARQGTTVFFSSHILDHVETVCDRVGILSDGELVTVDTIDGLRREIGGESTVTLTLDTMPASALDGVSDVDGVADVTCRGTMLDIICTDPVAKATAISRIQRTEATVLNVRIEERSLESLFAELTGTRPSNHDRRNPESDERREVTA
ncbi:ABC transporter ATP-binding protein [Halomontanus rarus]|uniref:ABC transporter ATP-binding protein n=1 Tax=Halomontanus rarus TaxID=3034020 RepID=UPI0023E89E7B|nr:ABC transporter ATP-binding protein [Halovivax sp. TS33]